MSAIELFQKTGYLNENRGNMINKIAVSQLKIQLNQSMY